MNPWVTRADKHIVVVARTRGPLSLCTPSAISSTQTPPTFRQAHKSAAQPEIVTIHKGKSFLDFITSVVKVLYLRFV